MGGKGKCVGVRAAGKRIFGLHVCPERLDGNDPSAYSEVSVSSDVFKHLELSVATNNREFVIFCSAASGAALVILSRSPGCEYNTLSLIGASYFRFGFRQFLTLLLFHRQNE